MGAACSMVPRKADGRPLAEAGCDAFCAQEVCRYIGQVLVSRAKSRLWSHFGMGDIRSWGRGHDV